jgi:hypothetical protein
MEIFQDNTPNMDLIRQEFRPYVVGLNNNIVSRRFSMIVAEQATEALPTDHQASLASNRHVWLNQLIAKTLMIPLDMIMCQILCQHHAQRLFRHDNHLMKHFLPDRTHKPLAVGIEIRTPRR